MQTLLACNSRPHRLRRGAGLELLLRPLLTSGLRVPNRLVGLGPEDVTLLPTRGRGRRPSRSVQSLPGLGCLLVGARTSGRGLPASLIAPN